MNLTVRVRGGRDLGQLADRLDRAASTFGPRLVVAVQRDNTSPLAAVRSSFLGVEVSSPRAGGYHSGLRVRVAAATQARLIAAGVRFEVEAARVDPKYGNTLSWGVNGQVWVAPTFGHTAGNAEHAQRGQQVFEPTLRRFEAQWRSRIEREIEDIKRDIGG